MSSANILVLSNQKQGNVADLYQNEEPELSEFRKFLTQRFRSPARAWRVVLDVKACGFLMPTEFGTACRQAGWHHPHKPLWDEIKEAGGGRTVNLRGLDPETCNAIDSFVEKALSSFGDLSNFWCEVLDPDGDGICSRLEFVTYTKKALGISGKAAGRIFTMLDTLNVGWIAASELGYLDAFVPAIAEAEAGQIIASGDCLIPFPMLSDSRSLSTGQLPRRSMHPADPSFSDMSWMQSWDALASSSSTLMRSTSSHTSRMDAPQRSCRGACLRRIANNQLAKARWMGPACAGKLMSTAAGTPYAVYKKEVLPTMPTVGGDVHTLTFRYTNEFYREGMRRMKAHHEAHAQEMAVRAERAERLSQSPSQSSSRKGGRTPKSSRSRA
mmetsp:Transcript_127000/g.201452  ORF Transcript_127000/g.201452 Transcript_127000/m.201452 type:complete len:384 (+) Transcript_127000:98-1249(+)